MQVFGNYVFSEMFDKYYGKQYVGINYLTGDMTEAIDISDLDTNTSIIFGSNYFYYVSHDYLHRVNYITQTDERLFYMKGPYVDIYAAGKAICDLYQNRFSLVGNQLIFACDAPRWRKVVEPGKEGEYYWAESELEKSDSILNCLKAEGINLESDIELFCGNCAIDEEIKKHGAYELGYDMKETGYEYSCDADMVLAIDLDTDEIRVLSYQVGDFYKAYAIDNQILFDASPVYYYYVSYSGYKENIEHPSEVHIYNVNQEIVTQQLLGANVQSINQSEFMPPERAEKKGYVAYSANVFDTNSNNQGKQVICYDGETVPISNISNVSRVEVLRLSIKLGVLIDDSSMFYPVRYSFVWDESTQGFTWKKEN